jgi:hypothetical protein
MRSSAAIRPGFVKELALNVTVISLNKCGAALAAKSWQTRRTSVIVFSSTCERNALRQCSECQNLRNIGLEESTRWQMEELERNAEKEMISWDGKDTLHSG